MKNIFFEFLAFAQNVIFDKISKSRRRFVDAEKEQSGYYAAGKCANHT